QLGIGFQVFLTDNQGYPVLRTSTNKYSGMDRFWIGQLERDGLGNPRIPTNFYHTGVWACPSARWSTEVLRSISTDDEWSYYAYYAYNTDIFGPHMQRKNPAEQFGLQGHYNPV